MTMETEMPEEPIFSLEELMREDKLPPVFPSSQSSVSSEALVSQHLISEVCDQAPWPFGERYPRELESADSASTFNFANSSLALSPISIPRSPAEDGSHYSPSTSSSPESQGLIHDDFDDNGDDADQDLSGDYMLSERDFQLYLDDLKNCDEGLNSEPFSQVDFLEPNQQIRQETPSPHESYIAMSPSSGYLTSHNVTFNSSSIYPAAADSGYLTEMAPLEADNFQYETQSQELPPLTSTPPPQLPVFNHAQEENKPIPAESSPLNVKTEQDNLHTIQDNLPQLVVAPLVEEPSSSVSAAGKSTRRSTNRITAQKKVPVSRGRKRKFDGDDDKKKDQNKEAARRYREKKREEEQQIEEQLREVEKEREKLTKHCEGLVNQHRIYVDLMKEVLARRKAAKSSNSLLSY